MIIVDYARAAFFLGLAGCAGQLGSDGEPGDASADAHDTGAEATIFPVEDDGVGADTGASNDTSNVTSTNDAALDTFDDDTGASPADSAVDVPFDAGAQPTIDLTTVTVLNSPADVASWAATATITTLDLGTDGVYVNFTKRDGDGSWPDVPFGAPGDSLEYTLWIVLNVGGQWYTSGCIQYWRGLDRNGGPPSGYAANWYYDSIRWGPMTGHQPAVGEWVGFFVTAGNARNVTDHSGSIVFERSNVVVIPFPADPGAVFNF